jgi:hypothetical protein
MYKICSDIKIPERLNDRRTVCKYPWDKMNVGDSFYIEGYTTAKQTQLQSNGSDWARRNNHLVKFATRKEGDGIRVFRVN